MPNDPVKCSITAAINYEEDFAFAKNKEELALKIRSDYLPAIRELWAATDATVRLDSDGDVEVGGQDYTLVITKSSVIFWAGALEVEADSVRRRSGLVGQMLDSVFNARKSFKALEYAVSSQIRFFSKAPDLLGKSHAEAILKAASVQAGTKDIQSFRWVVRFGKDSFADTVEFNIAGGMLGYRYGRTVTAEKFGSSQEFLAAAHIDGMVGELQRLAQPALTSDGEVFDLARIATFEGKRARR
jgi:hypothetical protein